MFCAFEGPPKIVRLHGRGEAIEASHAEFDSLCALFPDFTGLRSVIRVHCHRVSDSCGWGVRMYDFKALRTQLTDYAERKGEEGITDYQQETNLRSLDGFPGITPRHG